MNYKNLIHQLGYTFQNERLLTMALTHRSHSIQHNERLEFLGDGVVNLAIAKILYERFPMLPEGKLSRMRAMLVKESTLSQIAISLTLGKYLKLGTGELRSGGNARVSILANTIEAIMGAILIDGGFACAEQVVYTLYQGLLTNLNPDNIDKDPKTRLQEILQSKHRPLPEYVLIAILGEAHCQTFQIECRIPVLKIITAGEGSSRKLAEQKAAEAACYLIASHD